MGLYIYIIWRLAVLLRIGIKAAAAAAAAAVHVSERWSSYHHIVYVMYNKPFMAHPHDAFVHSKTIDLPYCDRHHMPITNTIFAGQLIIIDFDANSILIQPLDDLRLQQSSNLDISNRIWAIFFHVL